MDKLKGVRKLNNAITKIFEGFETGRFKLTDTYQYSMYDYSIRYRITEGHIEDIWFNEFVKERFGYTVKNTFIFSILHEIGHHKTIEDVYESDIIYNYCMNEKNRIDAEMQTAGSKKSKKLEWEYFNLPDEIVATEWAVTYARTHQSELRIIWEKVTEALAEFYEKNNVEEG